MPTFDGDNLIITLDSGITEIDVIDDVYEPWKDWMLSSPLNRKYPQAFRSDGGNPLSSIINQGSYIFLNNTVGWRIKPPEEDITIYFTGNLAVEDTTLPAFIETDGAFTAAILGLQPVTQGVTDQMAEGIESITYIGKEGTGVTIDPINGIDSDIYPAGTRKVPCKTEDNLHAIEATEKHKNVYVKTSFNIQTDHSADPNIWFGDNPQLVNINCDVTSDVTGSKFQDCYITGKLDNFNIIWECIVGSITNANGFIYKSTFIGPIVVSENISVEDCWIAPTAPGQTCIVDFNNLAKTVIISDWSAGRIQVKNMVTGSFIGMSGTGGRLIIDAANSGGTAVHAGAIDVDDTYAANLDLLSNSTTAKQTWNQNEGKDLHAANFNRRKHDNVANTITIYDTDKTTPLHVFDADDELTDISPQ